MRKVIAKIRGFVFKLICKFQRKNILINDGLLVYKKLRIEGDGQVVIGENCVIDGIVGDDNPYVTISTHSADAEIHIGDNVCLYAARISSKYSISIGNNTLIEDSSIIDTDFHGIDKERGDPVNESKDKCKIIIGNNVCIGVKSFILKGITIEDNVVVLPGSIVSLSIHSDSVVLGNPARIIKTS